MPRIRNKNSTEQEIATKNPLYLKWLPIWEKSRDASQGQEAVKSKEEIYLPRGNGMTRNGYKFFLKLANYYNATAKTVEGLVGAMFRENPIITVPDDKKQLMENVTFGGKSMIDFAMEVADDQVRVSRTGIFIDVPQLSEDGEELTQAEADRIGQRPYMAMYQSESIINWQYELVSNGARLTRVVLVEMIEDNTKNKYQVEYIPQYRDLFIEKETGIYKQRIYANKASGEVDEEITPLKNGQPMTEIPFIMLTPDGEDVRTIMEPVIKDLADVNIGHYVNSASREQELWWAGVKTPCFPGMAAKDTIKMGMPMATPAGETPFILEAKSGSDIQAEMTRKEERMAVLGASIIAQQGRYVASATTAQINAAAEESTLSKLAKNLSRALTKAMRIMLEWESGREYTIEQVNIQINSDFNPTKLGSQDIIALVQAWQQGTLSKRQLFNNFKDGELVPDNLTFEQHEEQIAENPPEASPTNNVII